MRGNAKAQGLLPGGDQLAKKEVGECQALESYCGLLSGYSLP